MDHPDDLGAVLASCDASVSSGAEYGRLQRMRRYDGVYRWHSVSFDPVPDDDGVIAVWVVAAVDVHDRVVAERAMAHSEERFRLLAEVTSGMHC